MLRALLHLLHKSKRSILSDIAALQDCGYSTSDIRSVLSAVRDRKIKGSGIRAMEQSLRAAQTEVKRLKKQLEDGVTSGLLNEYGHTQSISTGTSTDKHGAPIPRLTYPSIEYLRQLDFSDKDVFEMGSGFSTLFWGIRARSVLSVEHNESKYAKLKPQVTPNVDYRLVTNLDACSALLASSPRKFDIIIFAGEQSPESVSHVVKKMAVGGMIILDDADSFPGIAARLRASDLIEVDFQGPGPTRNCSWTTSLFLHREIHMRPGCSRQPTHGPGSPRTRCDLRIEPKLDKPALDGLDDKLAKYLDYRNGFFIEAGANDGFSYSNTYHLENALGWSGILVEGIPDLAALCRESRARSVVVNAALVADSTATPTVAMHYSNLMSIVEGGPADMDAMLDHVRKGMEVQNISETYRIEVPGRTLDSIIDEHAAGRQVDFFSLDVEGFELEVLKGLDLTKHAPKYLLIETSRLDEVSAALGHRYEMIEQMSAHDYFFRRRELS